MKIVVFETEPWEYQTFADLDEQHDLVSTEDQLTADNADDYADADIISAFIYSDLSEDVLSRFDNLKLIATRSTGFDHIAVDHCQENDILVCNVPSYGQNTVVEHAFGLLLTISHNLYRAIDRTRKGDFSQDGLQGFDLSGKTLGVIGTGDIGGVGRGVYLPALSIGQERCHPCGLCIPGEYRLPADPYLVALQGTLVLPEGG